MRDTRCRLDLRPTALSPVAAIVLAVVATYIATAQTIADSQQRVEATTARGSAFETWCCRPRRSASTAPIVASSSLPESCTTSSRYATAALGSTDAMCFPCAERTISDANLHRLR